MPETRKPESRKPESRKPEIRKPENREPESRKPENRKPETQTPGTGNSKQTWNLELGATWNLEPGTWNLEPGTRDPAPPKVANRKPESGSRPSGLHAPEQNAARAPKKIWQTPDRQPSSRLDRQPGSKPDGLPAEQAPGRQQKWPLLRATRILSLPSLIQRPPPPLATAHPAQQTANRIRTRGPHTQQEQQLFSLRRSVAYASLPVLQLPLPSSPPPLPRTLVAICLGARLSRAPAFDALAQERRSFYPSTARNTVLSTPPPRRSSLRDTPVARRAAASPIASRSIADLVSHHKLSRTASA